jgi:hypothetical protein
MVVLYLLTSQKELDVLSKQSPVTFLKEESAQSFGPLSTLLYVLKIVGITNPALEKFSLLTIMQIVLKNWGLY